MISALLMLRRVSRAFRYAVEEEEFLPVFGAGVALVIVGSLSFALGEDWSVVDGFYDWIKVFAPAAE
jgi:hypothetical protein